MWKNRYCNSWQNAQSENIIPHEKETIHVNNSHGVITISTRDYRIWLSRLTRRVPVWTFSRSTGNICSEGESMGLLSHRRLLPLSYGSGTYFSPSKERHATWFSLEISRRIGLLAIKGHIRVFNLMSEGFENRIIHAYLEVKLASQRMKIIISFVPVSFVPISLVPIPKARIRT